jgi:F420-dependent oxidoreductase-like protein
MGAAGAIAARIGAMRIGIMAGTTGKEAPDVFADEARAAAGAGLQTWWLPQVFGYDALTALGWLGAEVPGIGFGTAVVPTWTRHPMVMAQQALTVAALAQGRFTLGIGLSHQVVIEGMLGIPWQRPVRHLSEYLDVLLPFLTERQHGPIQLTADGPAPPVLVAALGPKMLELAGARTDGTITWMTGPKTLASHTVPTLRRAAEAAGRPDPQVVAGYPVCVTDDATKARERAARAYALYGQLPSYRAMLDREGAAGPEDLAVVGDEAAVSERLAEAEGAGATEVMASLFGRPEEKERSRALLADLAGAS